MTAETPAPRTASAAPELALDVVVLGGGGHVGLPLSLALARAGLHVGRLAPALEGEYACNGSC